jgi:Ferritin-like domain
MANQVSGLERATNLGQSIIGHQTKRAARREFLRGLGLGLGAAGAAAAGATSFGRTSALAQQTDLDVAILEFALNLEFLEAEFYVRAAYGHGLEKSLLGPNPGPVTGGHKVDFTMPLVEKYAREIAVEERKHVEFISAALSKLNNGSVISCPAIDFTSSFPKLGSAAGLGPDFDPFKSDMDFMLGAYVFEDVGVTAYHGAATLITSKAVLNYAAGILAVEAYHAGLIRTVLFANGMSKETAAISKLRATLDGTEGTPNMDDHGVGGFSEPVPSIVNCSNAGNGTLLGDFGNVPPLPPGNNAIAYDRTTRQVLNIVYGSPNASSGLFFPNGLNGIIH